MAAVSSPRWTYQSSLDSNSNAIEQFSDFGDDDISNSGKYVFSVKHVYYYLTSKTMIINLYSWN